MFQKFFMQPMNALLFIEKCSFHFNEWMKVLEHVMVMTGLSTSRQKVVSSSIQHVRSNFSLTLGWSGMHQKVKDTEKKSGCKNEKRIIDFEIHSDTFLFPLLHYFTKKIQRITKSQKPFALDKNKLFFPFHIHMLTFCRNSLIF